MVHVLVHVVVTVPADRLHKISRDGLQRTLVERRSRCDLRHEIGFRMQIAGPMLMLHRLTTSRCTRSSTI